MSSRTGSQSNYIVLPKTMKACHNKTSTAILKDIKNITEAVK